MLPSASISRRNSSFEIGDLKAGLVLDFFLAEVAPSVHNAAIERAQAVRARSPGRSRWCLHGPGVRLLDAAQVASRLRRVAHRQQRGQQGRPPRRQQGRRERHSRHYRCRVEKRHRPDPGYLEHTAKIQRAGDGQAAADRHTIRRHSQSAADNQREHVPPGCAQRHAHADLDGPLTNRVSDDAVHPNMAISNAAPAKNAVRKDALRSSVMVSRITSGIVATCVYGQLGIDAAHHATDVWQQRCRRSRRAEHDFHAFDPGGTTRAGTLPERSDCSARCS